QIVELRRAVAKGAFCWLGELSSVGEPLNAYSFNRSLGNRRKAVAVCSGSAAKSARVILGSIDRQWPAGTERDDWANCPSSDYLVDYPIDVFSHHLSTTKGKVVNRIGGKHVCGVVVARRPLRPLIVYVLPVCRGTQRVIPCAVIARAI